MLITNYIEFPNWLHCVDSDFKSNAIITLIKIRLISLGYTDFDLTTLRCEIHASWDSSILFTIEVRTNQEIQKNKSELFESEDIRRLPTKYKLELKNTREKIIPIGKWREDLEKKSKKSKTT